MSSTIKLTCWIFGDDCDRNFEVEIPLIKNVGALKKAIKEKEKHAFQHFDADTLDLWKISLPFDECFEENLKKLEFNDKPLRSWEKMSSLFAHKSEADCLDIVVKVPRPDDAPDHHRDKRPRLLTDNYVGIVDLWRTNRSITTLPLVEELCALLEKPLADSERVPITQLKFNRLLSDIPPDGCSEDDLDTLFTIGEEGLGLAAILWAVVNPPPSSGTEYAFVSFWDNNIRNIVELLAPSGTSIRNSNKYTETKNLRPNFGFLLDRAFPFRGEEKGPENPDDAREELVQKLEWVYNPAPYMLAYYCNASNMTLCAITPPGIPGGKAGIFDIITVDLRFRRNRIANIRHLINLSPLFPVLAGLVPFRNGEFNKFDRMNSMVEMTTTSIIKTFKHQDAREKVKHLQIIYALIDTHSIPNTDKLITAKGKLVCLKPRGIASCPRVEKELRECLICVLDALDAAHKIKLYHRDIRWDNIIRRADDESKWFLIDWEHAAMPPTLAKPSFDKDTHSPDIFRDGHGAEVDIWAIGYLIRTSTVAWHSSEMMRLAVRICQESHELSAQDVLALLTKSP